MRVWCALIALLLIACNPDREGPSVGSNSNWLKACVAVKDCGDDAPACVCGACSERCSSDDDCEALPGAHCAVESDPAASASCGAQPVGLCLPSCEPGSCAEDQACVSGSCVLAALPDVALCADVHMRDAADRKREDELLAAIAALRSDGGVTCGSAAASLPVPAVRLDPRLICNARVLALDIAAHGVSGLTDSQGRTTPDRLNAVGYDQSLWGESFAIDARNADAALQYMLADADTCMRLSDARFHDVGVGVAGNTWVLTIASE
jgi:uncharacterized protein YkwD